LITLEKSALFRLERSSLSEKQLRDGLKRKCLRQQRAIDDEVRAWIDDVVAKMKRLGFVDDERTAAARARSLRATGTSARGAMMKLKQKGIDGALAARVLAVVDEEPDAELTAAREYVRRRRLTAKDPQKALAALARRGFSYDIAKRALTP
jgi:regulatory protein